MKSAPLSQPETRNDQVLAFAIPDRDCRSRIVRLGPVLDTILSAHDYPGAIGQLLVEALVLTTLMGGLLKGEKDRLKLQAQTKRGIISLLVCDYRNGELRGYVKHDSERLGSLASEPPSLAALFGEGHLAITFDIAETGRRYQGIVPLEGGSLSEAVEAYFLRSEQIPTLIRTATRLIDSRSLAGGMLVQHLARGEEGRERLHLRHNHPQWEHVSALARSLRIEELVAPETNLESLIWGMYESEREVRIERMAEVARGCRCSEFHFEEVLSRFPSEDRKEMRDECGVILVDCAFCSKEFAIQD